MRPACIGAFEIPLHTSTYGGTVEVSRELGDIQAQLFGVADQIFVPLASTIPDRGGEDDAPACCSLVGGASSWPLGAQPFEEGVPGTSTARPGI